MMAAEVGEWHGGFYRRHWVRQWADPECKSEEEELLLLKNEFRATKELELATTYEALKEDVWLQVNTLESDSDLDHLVAELRALQAAVAAAVMGLEGICEAELGCERKHEFANAEGDPVEAIGNWGGRLVHQTQELKGPEPSAQVEDRFFVEGRGPDALVSDGLVKQGNLAACVSESSTRELSGTHGGDDAAGCACVGDDMVEQSYLATSVSKSSTGELLGTHVWCSAGCAYVGDDLKKQSYEATSVSESSTRELSGTHGDGAAGCAYVGNDLEQSYYETSVSKSSTGELSGTIGRGAAGCAFVGDDLKKQSYLGVERGESLDEAAAAPTVEFVCDGWARVERSEFLDEAAAAPTVESGIVAATFEEYSGGAKVFSACGWFAEGRGPDGVCSVDCGAEELKKQFYRSKNLLMAERLTGLDIDVCEAWCATCSAVLLAGGTFSTAWCGCVSMVAVKDGLAAGCDLEAEVKFAKEFDGVGGGDAECGEGRGSGEGFGNKSPSWPVFAKVQAGLHEKFRGDAML